MSMAEHQSTVVVGDDTDLLILLCRHAPPVGPKLYFHSEPKANSRVPPRCWDIRNLRLCSIKASSSFMLYWDAIHHIFMELDSSAAKKEDIMKAEQTNISLSLGTGESLDDLRLQVFHKKVSRSTSCVQLQSFPPTSAASQVPQSEDIPTSPTVVWSRSAPNRLGMENTRRPNDPWCHRSPTSTSLSAWGYPLQL